MFVLSIETHTKYFALTNQIQITAEPNAIETLAIQASSAEESLNNKRPLAYDPSELRQIGIDVQHNSRLQCMPFGSISRIKELGLNRRLMCK